MAVKSKTGSSTAVILLVLAALALYLIDHLPREESPKMTPSQSNGRYETHTRCALVDFRNNDGDSFKVRFPDGSEAELRLYFVDTPESAFKNYPGGDTNHHRIRDQAADMGGVTPEQVVETGQAAKDFVIGLLESRPFTVHTLWDSPFDDERYHAFIEVESGGRSRWLHEILVERGLARISTKPADLPDGTSAERHRGKLRAMEEAARKSKVGVWRF